MDSIRVRVPLIPGKRPVAGQRRQLRSAVGYSSGSGDGGGYGVHGGHDDHDDGGLKFKKKCHKIFEQTECV